MTKIIDLLNKEKKLNELLNSQHFTEHQKLNKEFDTLFSHPFYDISRKWLNNNINPDIDLSLHDSFISNFSQKKNGNEYNISFVVEYITIYENSVESGYFSNNKFNINSNESLRDISNRTILQFLIDDENKEVAFLYLDKNARKSISVKYNDIQLVKGESVIYEAENKSTLKMK